MSTSNFVDHDLWFASCRAWWSRPAALITDPAGRMLLVKPNYRDLWTLPGGICEHGEPPQSGLRQGGGRGARSRRPARPAAGHRLVAAVRR